MNIFLQTLLLLATRYYSKSQLIANLKLKQSFAVCKLRIRQIVKIICKKFIKIAGFFTSLNKMNFKTIAGSISQNKQSSIQSKSMS